MTNWGKNVLKMKSTQEKKDLGIFILYSHLKVKKL